LCYGFCKGFLLRIFLLTLTFLFSPPLQAADTPSAVIQDILTRGETAVTAYDPNAPLATASEFSALYFERFEALELELGTLDSALKSELEVLFGALNGSAMRSAPPAQLKDIWLQLSEKLKIAQSRFDGTSRQSAGNLGTLLKAFFILLREGAEALLVIAALATWLRRAGAADKTWVIHVGTAIAVLASLATGLAIDRLLKGIGAPLAVVEGVTMLAASVMLFFVSCWLFAKRSAQRWEAWIAGQMESALSKGSLFALGSTAFLAVYREGAETVLFYQALATSASSQTTAIIAGFCLAALALAALYFILRYAALRLPFGLFFGSTSALLYLLCIIFIGQAIVELQAAGWIASIYLPGIPQISWLGIAPSAQSLGAQAMLLALPIFWFVWQKRRTFSPATSIKEQT
jgi:high-affinity iron transporter